MDKVLQDGSVGRDPNARPNENRYVICVPVLLSGAVWTIEVQLKKAEPSLGIGMLFTFEKNWSSAHALGGVSGVASFITTDEQLQ